MNEYKNGGGTARFDPLTEVEEQRAALEETNEWLIAARQSSREYLRQLRMRAFKARAESEMLRCRTLEIRKESHELIVQCGKIRSQHSSKCSDKEL